MVASRDIAAGETIFVESPLTFGPSEETRPVCLGCYTVLSKEKGFVACAKCGFPMCSNKCAQIKEHRDQECKAFQVQRLS